MTLDSHLFVVFGATGDLMKRKLLPALYELLMQDYAEGTYAILGVSRSDLSDDAFRATAEQAMRDHGLSEDESCKWCQAHLYYESVGKQKKKDYERVKGRIEGLEEELGLPGNRVFYLALPPGIFEDTIEMLGKVKLHQPANGWTRIVVEKPFGRDLASARELNDIVHTYFAEDQIYRIDHYLGKETVQNLMVFRFGNAIFESLWNRDFIEKVDVLVAEDLGVGDRAGYYDTSGALRDMIQNHLTQLLTLVAMEVPAVVDADAIRYEKVKVLQSVAPIDTGQVVYGQYTRGTLDGKAIPGYREEPGIPDDSETETYVALRLYVNNWRWQGVPFTLQTGKRLPRAVTRIDVTFRRPPVALFRNSGDQTLSPNVLRITVQPDEGFSLGFEVKKPGEGFDVETHYLRFKYEEVFGALPGAYRTLLEDVVRGDQMLFVHADEVIEAWRLYDPLLDQEHAVHFYSAGTWQPPEAKRLTNQHQLDG